MTSASDLTQRITLQTRAATRDDYGQVVGAVSDVATVWAHVRPNAQRSAQAGAEPVATSFVVVTIRVRSLTGVSRFVWRGQAWDIVGEPLPVDRAWLRFDAQLAVRDAATVLPVSTS